MSNKVIGTGEIDIIFSYEENLKKVLDQVKKEWQKLNINETLDRINSSMQQLNSTVQANTTTTSNNNTERRNSRDLNERIYNQQLMLNRAMQNANADQRAYIQTLRQQLDAGNQLTSWQRERIKLLGQEEQGQRNNNVTYGLATYGLQQLGSAMLGVAKEVVTYQAKIESSLATTSAVAGSGKEGIEQLQSAMIKMGTDTPIQFQTIANSMYDMASAGLSVNEVLEAMPTALMLSKGVGENLNQTTELLISTVKAFDLEFSDSKEILDVFANSVAKSMGTIEKLQVSFARVAPVAQQAGVSFQETTAILSKLYDLGLKGSNAGTVLGNVMTKLTSFTKQSEEALKSAGLTTQDVSLEYNNLGTSLAKLTMKMKEGKFNAEQFQAVFGTRGKIISDFMNQLEGNNIDELVASYDKLVASISDASGSVSKFYEVQADTTEMALNRSQNAIDRLKLAAGDSTKEYIIPLANSFADLTNNVAEFAEKSDAANTSLGILTTTMGGLGAILSGLGKIAMPLMALSSLQTLFASGGIVAGITSAISAIGSFTLGLFGAVGTVASFATGVGAVITILGVLAGAFSWFSGKKSEALAEEFDAIGSSAEENAENIKKLNSELERQVDYINKNTANLQDAQGKIANLKKRNNELIEAIDNDFVKNNEERIAELKRQANEEILEMRRNISDVEKQKKEEVKIKAKYMKQMKADEESWSKNYKEILAERQKATDEKLIKEMGLTFGQSKLQFQSWGDYLVDIFRGVTTNSGEMTKAVAENILNTMENIRYIATLNIGEQQYLDKNYVRDQGQKYKNMGMSSGEASVQAQKDYDLYKSLTESFKKDIKKFDAIKASLEKGIKTGNFVNMKTPTGGGSGGNNKGDKTTPSIVDSTQLANEYSKKYMESLKNSVEAEYNQKIISLQNELNTKKITQEEYDKKYKETFVEKNKKINDSMLNALKNPATFESEVKSLMNLKEKNLNGFNENEFSSGVKSNYVEQIEKYNPVELPDITNINKDLENNLNDIRDYSEKFSTGLNGISKSAKLLADATTEAEKDGATRVLLSNLGMVFESIDNMTKEQKESEMSKILDRINKGESPEEVLNDYVGLFQKATTDLYDISTQAKNKAKDTYDKRIEELKKINTDEQNKKNEEEIKNGYGRIEKLDTDNSEKQVANINSVLKLKEEYKQKTKDNYQKSLTELKNYFDNINATYEQIGEFATSYSETDDAGLKSTLKTQISDMIASLYGLPQEEIDKIVAQLDTTKDGKVDLTEYNKSINNLNTNFLENLTKNKKYLDIRADYDTSKEKALETDAETNESVANDTIDIVSKITSVFKKFKTAIEDTTTWFEKNLSDLQSIAGSLQTIGSMLGSDFISSFGSGLSGLLSGIESYNKISSSASLLSNVGAGLGAFSGYLSAGLAVADMMGFGDKSSEIEAENQAQLEKYDEMLSALETINETLKGNFGSLVEYAQTTAENTIPTKENLAKNSSQFQNIYNLLSSQERNFSDLSYVIKGSASAGLFKGGKDTYTTYTKTADDLFTALGYSGSTENANLDTLQSFSDQLQDMTKSQLATILGVDANTINSETLDVLAEQIENYVQLIIEAQEQIRDFSKTATISDFVGMSIQDVDDLYEELKTQYEEMGVELTSEIETQLYKLAESTAISETITSTVRDGFVDGWAEGQTAIESLSSGLEEYFSGILTNISKTFYDDILSDFNSTLSTFYKEYMIALEEAKYNGEDTISFATNYDYSSVLEAIVSAQKLNNTFESITDTIREQAEALGVNSELIDEMLGDDYRITIRENIATAISDGIMDGFNNGEITTQDIQNSIFSTIVQQAMSDIIDSIMDKNGISGIVTEIIDALEDGDTSALESLGLALTDSVNAGLDEASSTIEYLLGLIDKYSGTNSDPIVFFDESNLESIQNTIKNLEGFSIETTGLSSTTKTTRRVEIVISSDNSNLSDEALKKIASQISKEVGYTVSTTRYI